MPCHPGSGPHRLCAGGGEKSWWYGKSSRRGGRAALAGEADADALARAASGVAGAFFMKRYSRHSAISVSGMTRCCSH